MREEELVALFDYIEALIDAKDRASGIEEAVRANELRQDAINLIAFEEGKDEQT